MFRALLGPARWRKSNVDEVSAAGTLAQSFFDALECGDIDAVARCYHDEVVIWHNTDRAETSKADNLAVLAKFIEIAPVRTYEDRRLRLFPGGFVHQHVLHMTTPDGRRHQLAACLVCAVRDGQIVRLDEYFDSAELHWLSEI